MNKEDEAEVGMMEDYSIYNDIVKRTDGSIYAGVVGPVRTGKSTFIKKFMETLVLPNVDNEFAAARARDELPQSASGRTIMTTEPKFIPNEAVTVELDGKASFKVRLIDCVGYVVDSALGYIEDEMPRMVSTPWFDEPIPFPKAAEIGTKKVINEHSTIGLVITTDGSITEIPREEYIEAEARVIEELQALNKPFVVLLNSAHPQAEYTQDIKNNIAAKYNVPVMAVNCLELSEADIKKILETVLFEFPIREISLDMPSWVDGLPSEHWLKEDIYKEISSGMRPLSKVRQINDMISALEGCSYIDRVSVDSVGLGDGTVSMRIEIPSSIYYKILSEICGTDIKDDWHLVTLLKELSAIKTEYDKVSNALEEVKVKGYGIVTPCIDELTLEEPQIVRHGGRFGVKLRASAPSIHMIRADIQTEVSPIVGSEQQSEELIEYLMKDFEIDPKKIWESNFFGKSLHDLVNEGLHNKLYRMPDDARFKLQETLQKIINEGSGGLICIIL